jgi:phosphate acyltransferase
MNHSGNNSSRCRIVVDAMGGDFAPANAVLGAIEAFSEKKNFDLFLVGKEKLISEVLSSNNLFFPKNFIVNADEVIEMGDSPAASLKTKPNSSIIVGAQLVRDKKADAFVSAGNTGAMVMSSILNIGRLPGISRPALTAPFPNEKEGYTFISDVGAFVDSKPDHLLNFAILSSIFIKEVYGIKNPKVGILNVGEEASKGYKLTLESSELLKKANLNFIGNLEGKDIFKGVADLVICDGFIGNILLKFAESIIPFLRAKFKNYADKSLLNKLRIGIVRKPMRETLKSANYEELGGLPLLGVNGISIVGHGSSSVKAIKNMVLRANEMHQKQLVQKMTNAISEYSVKN